MQYYFEAIIASYDNIDCQHSSQDIEVATFE